MKYIKLLAPIFSTILGTAMFIGGLIITSHVSVNDDHGVMCCVGLMVFGLLDIGCSIAWGISWHQDIQIESDVHLGYYTPPHPIYLNSIGYVDNHGNVQPIGNVQGVPGAVPSMDTRVSLDTYAYHTMSWGDPIDSPFHIIYRQPAKRVYTVNKLGNFPRKKETTYEHTKDQDSTEVAGLL